MTSKFPFPHLSITSRLLYPTAYLTSPFGHLVDISNLVCLKQNSRFCCRPPPPPQSPSSKFHSPVSQAQNLAATLNSFVAFISKANPTV